MGVYSMFMCDGDGTEVQYSMHTIYSNGDFTQNSHSLKKQRRHKVYFSSIFFGSFIVGGALVPTHKGTVVRELRAVHGMVNVFLKKNAFN